MATGETMNGPYGQDDLFVIVAMICAIAFLVVAMVVEWWVSRLSNCDSKLLFISGFHWSIGDHRRYDAIHFFSPDPHSFYDTLL